MPRNAPLKRSFVTTLPLLSAIMILSAQRGSLSLADQPRSPAERAQEVDAKCWFNAQPVRIHDRPELILLEFWSVESRESRAFVDTIAGLHKALANKGLLVVALSSDDCEEVQRFIRRREEIKYKVGAESRSAKKYGIDELPGVVLIDPRDGRIVGRWTGKAADRETIAKAVRDFLGPHGSISQPGGLPPDQMALLQGSIAELNVGLGETTETVLAGEGEITPKDLAPLEMFYQAHLVDDPGRDDAEARALNYARGAMLGDKTTGYGRLFESGRLTDAAKIAIRDRLLEIASGDPSRVVRISAVHALRKFGQPNDAVLLDELRRMRDSVGTVEESTANPPLRTSIDKALEDLGPNRSAALQREAARPNAVRLRRMLSESPNPAASSWADAYAYGQTVGRRSTEELLADYLASREPQGDEIGRQNAALKRDSALDELGNRIVRGEIEDLGVVKEHLAAGLAAEPDEWIRGGIADDLWNLAKTGGQSRSDVADLFRKRLQEEQDLRVKAKLEVYVHELDGG